MSPRARRRPATGDDDVSSQLQTTLDREERRRRSLKRIGLATGALTLVIAVAAGTLLQGNASAADRAEAARNAEPAASVPATVADLPAPSSAVQAKPAPRAPVKRKPRPAAKKPPARKPAAAKPPAAKLAVSKPKTQRLRVTIGSQGYEPSVIQAKAGQPIVLSVGRGEGCAAGFLIPKLGVEKDNSGGSVTVRLGRVSPGRYRFSCGMGMVTGTLIVK